MQDGEIPKLVRDDSECARHSEALAEESQAKQPRSEAAQQLGINDVIARSKATSQSLAIEQLRSEAGGKCKITPSQPSPSREGVSACHSEALAEESQAKQPRSEAAQQLRSVASTLSQSERGKKERKAAFTLAEVLITLGIVGIVAAMTIPGLITKYHKQVTATQLKKVFSLLNQTMLRISEDPGMDVLAQKPSVFVPQYIQPHFPGSIYYAPSGLGTHTMCYDPEDFYIGSVPARYGYQYASITSKGLSSGAISTPFLHNTTASIRLMDGTCIGFNKLIEPDKYPTATIFVDLNGSNVGPNRLGRDLFWFYVDQDKNSVVPTEKCGNFDFEKLKVGAKIIKDAGWTIPKNYPWK